jgi:hypothetical protein
MKNIFKSTILFVLLINAGFSSLAQKTNDIDIEKQLFTIADTFRTKYWSGQINLSVDKSLNFTFDKNNNYYTLTIPVLNDCNYSVT